MYIPDPANLFMIWATDILSGYSGLSPYPLGVGIEFSLPDEGYLLRPDFTIIYDVTKVDDGTVAGDNDAQIIVLNELLKYFAFHERNWYKIAALVDRIYNPLVEEFDFISSTRRIIIPPPVSLSDCTRKLFGVGTRYMPEWAQYNDDIALCLKAYAAYYRSGGESPIDENGNIKDPKYVLAEYSFTTCEEWFDRVFTLAIGDWRSATTSGWYKSKGRPIVDSVQGPVQICL